jgi:hypothetical protein
MPKASGACVETFRAYARQFLDHMIRPALIAPEQLAVVERFLGR